MKVEMNTFEKPTSEERLWAAVAHGSILFIFLGPIVSLLVWVTQRRKSKYASFQALQALGFQTGMFWLWILFSIVLPIVFVIIVLVIAVVATEFDWDSELIPLVMNLVFFGLFIGSFGIMWMIGLIGTIACGLGFDFRYPFLGSWLAEYLISADGPDLDEAAEDHWVAAMGHASGIFWMWGAITPLLAWFTQKDRSPYLRVQALQAAVLQGSATLLYFLGYILYLIMNFGMMFVLFLGIALMESSKTGSVFGVIIMLLYFAFVGLFGLAFMLLGVLYLVYLVIATVQSVRGKDFRYPFLGNWLARKLQPAPDVPLPVSDIV